MESFSYMYIFFISLFIYGRKAHISKSHLPLLRYFFNLWQPDLCASVIMKYFNLLWIGGTVQAIKLNLLPDFLEIRRPIQIMNKQIHMV